jgi:hypothetical protein
MSSKCLKAIYSRSLVLGCLTTVLTVVEEDGLKDLDRICEDAPPRAITCRSETPGFGERCWICLESMRCQQASPNPRFER